jgi:hypothetical protein
LDRRRESVVGAFVSKIIKTQKASMKQVWLMYQASALCSLPYEWGPGCLKLKFRDIAAFLYRRIFIRK